MHRVSWWFRGVIALLAFGLLAAACSSSRSTNASTNGGNTTTTSGTSASSKTFGTLASPCGPGSAKGATDQGVTDTAIHIASGDDRGFAGSPGLDEEMGQAIAGMVKWCNDQGGILGRQIVNDFYDAAVTQVNTAMQQACKADFMLVGEGWALDESAESIRLGCNLAAVPGFSVGPDFANAPEMYQAVPNPVDYLPASPYYEAAQLFPNAIGKFDFIHTTLASATEVSYAKDQEAALAAGWKLANNGAGCGVTLNYFGVPDYKPFAQKFVNCGVTMIYSNIGPGPVLFGMLQANSQLSVKPIYIMETNDYTSQMAQWNTSGIGDQIYARDAFVPLEEASRVKAVQDYLNIVQAVGGKTSQLGQQAASSFLLWATEAKACGSNLTRQCMINNLSKVHTWTGGGLHTSGDTGNNTPPMCGMLLKLTGTSWSQFYPKTIGQFDCSAKYLFKISSAHWGKTLNSQRLSPKFLSPNLIMPKS